MFSAMLGLGVFLLMCISVQIYTWTCIAPHIFGIFLQALVNNSPR
jgi:hypothetical protein